MPTIARIGPYRFFFYANDRGEPPHVHVERERSFAKFWLDPVVVETSRGCGAHELREIERIVTERAGVFLGAWNAFFGASE
jgi:hypothetical protein